MNDPMIRAVHVNVYIAGFIMRQHFFCNFSFFLILMMTDHFWPSVHEKSALSTEIPSVHEKSALSTEIPSVHEKSALSTEIPSVHEKSALSTENKKNRFLWSVVIVAATSLCYLGITYSLLTTRNAY